jgi:probable rRNA maturation factor
LTDDRELRRLNREFRGKDCATDVLSFPTDGPTPGELLMGEPSMPAIGDIAISVQRAAEQARDHGHTVDHEVCILMLHGVLHLLGHDHERDGGRMRRIESKWRRKLGLSSGLIERAARPDAKLA